jgi:hypothetical protein
MLVAILKGPQLCIVDGKYMLECISSICYFLDDKKLSNGSHNTVDGDAEFGEIKVCKCEMGTI